MGDPTLQPICCYLVTQQRRQANLCGGVPVTTAIDRVVKTQQVNLAVDATHHCECVVDSPHIEVITVDGADKFDFVAYHTVHSIQTYGCAQVHEHPASDLCTDVIATKKSAIGAGFPLDLTYYIATLAKPSSPYCGS